ncbi:TonB-dependent receptor [Pseudocolwellia agarivorans]|uniref:TonB-dependent receptor n=1 Tax=Pseudocolwellia agarivorans TaxID=1911682 RepID=UPI0015885D16|nr:TonB-dependent receptor [Pseudocolwellia agarivorans]
MKKPLQNTLKTSLSAIALIVSGQGLAQETETKEVKKAPEVELIQVVGIRSSLEQAVLTKRMSPVITDVISSTELGRFPDENVAESLQRITGVQIERVRGEGSRVSIRGLPPTFTLTTLNDRSLASAFALDYLGTASRNFEFSSLPSEFVSSLEVHKTPMASLQEGGLSGTVVVRTHSPIDIGKRKFAFSAQGAHESNSGKLAPRMSGMYSDVFADGKVGVSIGAAYTERNAESHSSLSRGFRKSRNYTQNLLLLEKFEEEKERTSLIGRIEYEPLDNLRLYTEVFQTELDNLSIRSQTAYNFGNTVGRINDTSAEQVIESGTIRQDVDGNLLTTKTELTNVEVRPGGRYQSRQGKTTAYAFGGKYEFDNWLIDGELSYSKSDQIGDGLNILSRGYISQAGYDTTLDDEMTSLILSDAAQLEVDDPNNYEFLSFFGEFGSEIEDEISSLRFDVTRHFDDGFFTSIKFGASIKTQEQYGISKRLDVDKAEFASIMGLTSNGAGGYNGAPVIELVGAGSGDFLDGYSGAAYVPDMFLRAKTRSVVESFSRTELTNMGTMSTNETGTIDAKEDILSYYVQADFSTLDDRLTGNFGLRIVETDQETSGIAPDLSAITFQPDAGALITIPAGGPIDVSRSYTDTLPSLNLAYEVNEDVVARFSASRTMSRPALAQISPSTTANNVPPTLNTNNPYLDPFRSNNFDMSLEWYFDNASILSATLFQKELVSLIERETNNEDLNIIELSSDGSQRTITEEFVVNTFKNGEGVDMKGIELTFQHNFSNLPGILSNMGTMLNYTYIDNSEPEKVTGASENNFNASGYYEGDKLSVRLSYTWRDDFLINAGAQEGFGRYIKASGVLDGNISYDVTENVSVVIEAINLLDTPTASVDGNGYPAIYEDNGRRLLFGVKGNF